MKAYLLITVALLFTTSGQLLQKMATARLKKYTGVSDFLGQILLFKETWWAVICLGFGVITWLIVLYNMDVSKATPFLSLGFIMVTLVSRYKLKEKVPVERWLGVVLITAGLWLVSLS